MQALAGPFAMACLLLVAGGVATAASPGGAAAALRARGLGVRGPLVRLGGVAEASVGLVAVVVGGRPLAAAVALIYLGFAGFVALGRRAGDAGCGCFGAAEAPPTWLHVGLALAAAAAALTASLTSVPGARAVLRHQPWDGVPLVLVVLVGTGLALALLTTLPRTLAAAARVRPRAAA